MIADIVREFPNEWLTDISVARGGHDERGYPVRTGEPHVVGPCLVSTQSSSEDDGDLSSVADTRVHVFCPVGADIGNADFVTVPPGLWPSGDFQVDGDPTPTPLGLRATLRRA